VRLARAMGGMFGAASRVARHGRNVLAWRRGSGALRVHASATLLWTAPGHCLHPASCWGRGARTRATAPRKWRRRETRAPQGARRA